MRLLILFILSLLMVLNGAFSQDMKESDFSGVWYSADPQQLRRQINIYFKDADVSPPDGEVVSLICPHAGISASGHAAAYAFKAVAGKDVDTVVVVGFSHRLGYEGTAVFGREGFRTPLGDLYTDTRLSEKLAASGDEFIVYPRAFEQENSIELILPFIQVAFGSPKVVLLAIGRQSPDNSRVLADGLYRVLKGEKNTLVVASTDLSHYLPLFEAKKIDRQTVERLEGMDPEELFRSCAGENRMCGLGAVAAVMMFSEKMGADRLEVLKLSSSARTGAVDEQVVGYLSAAFVKQSDAGTGALNDELLDDKQRKQLLDLARETITHYLDTGEVLEKEVSDSRLKQIMGVFVTLRRNGALRGCIGNIVGRIPLYRGVKEMAVAAASADPRFPPLSKDELGDIDIEISVLSPLKKVEDPAEIILGTHGVLVRKGYRSGVYLPQVAEETGWSKEEFLSSLCAHKAGISPDAW